MTAETPLSVSAVVRLRPGDVVLFRCPHALSPGERARVVEMLNDVFEDFESIILEKGQDIAVLRPEPGIIGRIWNRLR